MKTNNKEIAADTTTAPQSKNVSEQVETQAQVEATQEQVETQAPSEAQQAPSTELGRLAPPKLILPGSYRINLDLIQKQIGDLQSLGGKVKVIEREHADRIVQYYDKKAEERAEKSGRSLNVSKAKADLDGSLKRSGLPSGAKLAVMVKLNLITAKDATKLKALMAFSEATFNLIHA